MGKVIELFTRAVIHEDTELLNLSPTDQYSTNVHCGLVMGNGIRTSGCGAAPTKSGYRMYTYSDMGCTSTVHYCPKCEQKLKETA